MDLLLQSTINGLSAGAIYACIAIGFTLIFGIAQLIYFAQCEMAMLGAFVFGAAYTTLSQLMPGFAAITGALLLTIPAVALVSCAGQQLLLRPLAKAPKVKGLIASLGLSIILQNVVALGVTSDERRFPLDAPASWNFDGLVVTLPQIVIFAGLLLLWLAVTAILYQTSIGRTIRAVAQSKDGARLMGINTEHAFLVTFALTAATATIGGIFMGLYNGSMRFDMGFVPGVKGFTVAILGGIGSIHGAIVAGLCLGLAEGLFATYVSSDYRDALAFAVLVGVLLVRPKGLFGEQV